MFIGFDYGTANCSVAVMRDNLPQLLTLENGSKLLPSMLSAPTREAVSEWLYRHHDVPTNGAENQALLRRAINTANVALDEADRLWIPVQRSWRLNERHYGALQGKNKTEIRQEYGDEKFMLWRRSYATPPPEIDPNDEYAQNNDPRYTGDPVPEAECLADVVKRVEPYFKSDIEPELKAGKTVLIAAHGNSLRAIVKMLDNLSEEEIAKVNIPTAMPLLYELDENFKPIKPRGEYLDPEAAAAGAAAVAAQGQK